MLFRSVGAYGNLSLTGVGTCGQIVTNSMTDGGSIELMNGGSSTYGLAYNSVQNSSYLKIDVAHVDYVAANNLSGDSTLEFLEGEVNSVYGNVLNEVASVTYTTCSIGDIQKNTFTATTFVYNNCTTSVFKCNNITHNVAINVLSSYIDNFQYNSISSNNATINISDAVIDDFLQNTIASGLAFNLSIFTGTSFSNNFIANSFVLLQDTSCPDFIFNNIVGNSYVISYTSTAEISNNQIDCYSGFYIMDSTINSLTYNSLGAATGLAMVLLTTYGVDYNTFFTSSFSCSGDSWQLGY